MVIVQRAEMQKSKTRSNGWLWHRNSESLAGDVELPGGDELEVVEQRSQRL